MVNDVDRILSFNDDETNYVELVGDMATDFTYNHEMYGEKFFKTTISVKRQSDTIDDIPVIVSERLIEKDTNYKDSRVKIIGQLRSFNDKTKNEEKPKLVIFIFAKDFFICNENYKNDVTLTSYLCKVPFYRKSPSGREISDLIIAVNRSYNKSDYIPCVLWGRNARYSKTFSVSDELKLNGRLQSRVYTKLIDGDAESRVAYELSVNCIQLIRHNNFEN